MHATCGNARNTSTQWFRTAKNWDVSTGPITRLLAPLTHLLAPHCSLCLCSLLCSFVPSLAHSLIPELVEKSMSQNGLVLSHSAFPVRHRRIKLHGSFLFVTLSLPLLTFPDAHYHPFSQFPPRLLSHFYALRLIRSHTIFLAFAFYLSCGQPVFTSPTLTLLSSLSSFCPLSFMRLTSFTSPHPALKLAGSFAFMLSRSQTLFRFRVFPLTRNGGLYDFSLNESSANRIIDMTPFSIFLPNNHSIPCR